MADVDLLNHLIATATGGLLLKPGATYDAQSSVQVLEKPHFTLDLNGATILRSIRQRGHAVMSIHVRNSPGFRLINGHVVGHKDPKQGYVAAVEGAHGLGVFATDGWAVEGVTIEHVPGDALYVASVGGGGPNQPPAIPSRNGTIDNVAAEDMGRHPISATGCDGLQIGVTAPCSFIGWYGAVAIDREPRVHSDVSQGIVNAPDNRWQKKAA